MELLARIAAFQWETNAILIDIIARVLDQSIVNCLQNQIILEIIA